MPYLRAAHADADYEEGLPAHMVSHHSNSDGISPSLTLMSPSNFHKMHTLLRVTNTCHCLLMMTYTNIQHMALLFHYFFHTKLIPKPPSLLLCSLDHHYIRPPASAAARKLPTMCLAPRRPPEKETLVWWLLAFVPPFSGCLTSSLRKDTSVQASCSNHFGSVLIALGSEADWKNAHQHCSHSPLEVQLNHIQSNFAWSYTTLDGA